MCNCFHFHLHLSLNHSQGCWVTTDNFTTSFLHFSLFSTALWDLAKSRPVRSLMSSHLFFCLLGFLPPFTLPGKMVLARPDEWETCPSRFSVRLFTIVRRSVFIFIFFVFIFDKKNKKIHSCKACDACSLGVSFIAGYRFLKIRVDFETKQNNKNKKIKKRARITNNCN